MLDPTLDTISLVLPSGIESFNFLNASLLLSNAVLVRSASTCSFVIFTFMQIITGEQFFSVFQIIIAFYFGTQYQKNVSNLKDDTDNNGEE